MTAFTDLSSTQKQSLKQTLENEYTKLGTQKLQLDMTRGKPSSLQLDLSNALLNTNSYTDSSGVDCRNYGGLDGLADMKALFGEILQIPSEHVIIGGNASLSLMFDTLARACLFGVNDHEPAWQGQSIKFLCPSPGYDRHFTVSQTLGIESIRVDMTDDGPNMGQVEELVANDAQIKGIWCVPKYSNPTGVCYSDKTVDRLANMPTAASDFRIMWDNAYAEHHFSGELTNIKEIINACAKAGNPDRPYVFASTSKLTFAGAGISAFASSLSNVAYARKYLGAQSIGPDKINQLRHLALFPNLASLREHMNQHAKLLKPKFMKVEKILSEQLLGTNTATWTQPKGGYFTSLDLTHGSAKRVIQLCADIGVKLTEAGAPFPYGIDPNDANIRIAPSFPSIHEIETAMQALTLSIKLAALEALI